MRQDDNTRSAEQRLAEYMGNQNVGLPAPSAQWLGAETYSALVAPLIEEHGSAMGAIRELNRIQAALTTAADDADAPPSDDRRVTAESVSRVSDYFKHEVGIGRGDNIDAIFDPTIPNETVTQAGSGAHNWAAENRLSDQVAAIEQPLLYVSPRAQRVLGITDTTDLISKAYTESAGDIDRATEYLMQWETEIAGTIGQGQRGQRDELDAIRQAQGLHATLLTAGYGPTLTRDYAQSGQDAAAARNASPIGFAENALTEWLDEVGLNTNVHKDVRRALSVEHTADLISEALYYRTSVHGALLQLNEWQHDIPGLLKAHGAENDNVSHRAITKALKEARTGLRRIQKQGFSRDIEHNFQVESARTQIDAASIERVLGHPLSEVRKHLSIEVTDQYPESLLGRKARGLDMVTIGNKTTIFAPNVKAFGEMQDALRAEVVSHVSIRELLGEEEYKHVVQQASDIQGNMLDPQDPQNQLITATLEENPHLERNSEAFGRAVIAQAARWPNKPVSLLDRARVGLRRFLRRTGLAPNKPMDRIELNYLLEKASAFKPSPGAISHVRTSPSRDSEAVATQRSPMRESLAQTLGTPQPADAMRGVIHAQAQAGMFSVEELEWSGLESWLDREGSRVITPAEVLDYIDENNLQLEETVEDRPMASGEPELTVTKVTFDPSQDIQTINAMAGDKYAQIAAEALADGQAVDKPATWQAAHEQAVSEWRDQTTRMTGYEHRIPRIDGETTVNKYMVRHIGVGIADVDRIDPDKGTRSRIAHLENASQRNIRKVIEADGLEHVPANLRGLPPFSARDQPLTAQTITLRVPENPARTSFIDSHGEANVVARIETTLRGAVNHPTLLVDKISSEWHEAGKTEGFSAVQPSDIQSATLAVERASENLSQAGEALIDSVGATGALSARQSQITRRYLESSIKSGGQISTEGVNDWLRRPENLIPLDVHAALVRVDKAREDVYAAESLLATAGSSSTTHAATYAQSMTGFEQAREAALSVAREEYSHSPAHLRRVEHYIDQRMTLTNRVDRQEFESWRATAGLPQSDRVDAAIANVSDWSDTLRTAEFGQPESLTLENTAIESVQRAHAGLQRAQHEVRVAVERSPGYTDRQRAAITAQHDAAVENGQPEIRPTDLMAWSQAINAAPELPGTLQAKIDVFTMAQHEHEAATSYKAGIDDAQNDGVPVAPLANAWEGIAVRRVIQAACETGAERVDLNLPLHDPQTERINAMITGLHGKMTINRDSQNMSRPTFKITDEMRSAATQSRALFEKPDAETEQYTDRQETPAQQRDTSLSMS